MKALAYLTLGLAAASTVHAAAEDLLDHVAEALTVSAFHDQVRSRLSGLIDLEYYHFDQPPPGLIDAPGHNLFNPRLTLFLDSQIGSHVYFFAQSRLDRGFDPSNGGARVRLDEYAVRFTPWDNGYFNLQVGKFSSVIGNWKDRHLSWENPFITGPLPYENITAVSEFEAPGSAADFLHRQFDKKYEYNPIIWGPAYATGASVAGRVGQFDYAAEIKNAALGSTPGSWDPTERGFEHPTYTGRLGFRPDLIWNFGFSASSGPYLREEARPSLPAGRGIGDYSETVFGQDVRFAWRHWQVWAEVYEARFEIPRVGNADSVSYFLEAKYKFAPQLFGALRWNQQLYGSVTDGQGGHALWGDNIWRIDSAIGYRFTAHTQLKLQYSLQHQAAAAHELGHTVAVQFTIRF